MVSMPPTLAKLSMPPYSAPETRRPSTAVSHVSSRPGSSPDRLPDLINRQQPRVLVLEAPRAKAPPPPPPPVPKYSRPVDLEQKRGALAKGHGRLTNVSLSRMELGATPFGCPRWEAAAQPDAELARKHAKLLARLLKPSPPSPLRRYRGMPSFLGHGHPPAWMAPITPLQRATARGVGGATARGGATFRGAGAPAA